jgi:uncharacterized protein YbjQ (UPF0145 family)
MPDLSPPLLIVTTPSIEGSRCRPLGPVIAARCVSKSAVADFIANLRNWTIGGELPSYSRMLEITTNRVLEDIRVRASEMGADAVVGFRLVTSDVASGAAELIGYGTAVYLDAQ